MPGGSEIEEVVGSFCIEAEVDPKFGIQTVLLIFLRFLYLLKESLYPGVLQSYPFVGYHFGRDPLEVSIGKPHAVSCHKSGSHRFNQLFSYVMS